MNNISSISVILPAFNEEKNIENTLSNTINYLNKTFSNFEIIVVDDGSTDKTFKVVEQIAVKYHNIILKKHEINRGYGQSLKTGFDTASKEFIFFMDSDGQFEISDLDKLTPHITDKNIVIGYRYQRADTNIRKLNTLLYHTYLRTIFKLKVKDVDCAFKLFPREAYLKIRPIRSEGAFFSAEFLLKLIKEDYNLVEIAVNHYPRLYGSPTGANIGVILKMFAESFKMLLKS